MSLFAPDLPARKAFLRAQMKAARAALAPEARAVASSSLCGNLSAWLQTRAETRVAIYLARAPELDLDGLAAELLQADVVLCAPRVNLATNAIEFARLRDFNQISRGAYGIREPISDEITDPEIALVPGLAFDRNGGRLGMGGGYYDRVLASIPVKVGVCFGAQIVERVPMQPHDVRMDRLASELGLARCE